MKLVANLISRECAILHTHSRVYCVCLVALLPTLCVMGKAESKREFGNRNELSHVIESIYKEGTTSIILTGERWNTFPWRSGQSRHVHSHQFCSMMSLIEKEKMHSSVQLGIKLCSSLTSNPTALETGAGMKNVHI